MKFNFFIFLAALFSLTSCTDSRLIKYTESKVFPISAEMSESSKMITGYIESTKLKSLFDIPADGKVESFNITGLNLVLERLPSSEADLLDYNITFKNKEGFCLLANKKDRDVSVLFGKKSFNISSELNKYCVNELECNIDYLLSGEPYSCNPGILEYIMSISARDFAGQPKNFVGKVTGQLSLQVVYSVCESFPEGMFSDYPKCK